jgi:hypothetical protein
MRAVRRPFPASPAPLLLLAALGIAGAGPAAAAVDIGATLDANQLGLKLTNIGSFGFDLTNGNGGLEFPIGSGKTCMFAGGLWIGARVGGQVRASIAEYSMDFAPGPMAAGTFLPDRPEFRVYELSSSDTTGSAAWMAFAVPQGAPTSAGGTAPGRVGDQTLWSVYNDANPAVHTNGETGTPPLGVEVRQTTWAWDENSPRDQMAFLRFQIRNAGAQTLDSTWIGIWSDIDLGGATDDRFGSDPGRNLAYTYNDVLADFVYGTTPPAVGFKLLKGPRLSPGAEPSDAASLTMYPHADPANVVEVYRLLKGQKVSGAPWIDPATLTPTPYAYTGDPVAGSGWRMTSNSELRMMLTTGPFTMAPGDTQDVVVAIVVGQGTNHLDSIRDLRERCDAIWLEGSVLPGPPVVPVPPTPLASILMLEPMSAPAIGPVHLRFAAPLGTAWRLDVFDVRGRRVARPGEGVGTGETQALAWSPGSSQLGPGVYWVSLSSNDDRVSRRVVVLGR